MLRVVLDTNILISAINFGGLPEKILRLAFSDEVKLFISREIIAEVIGVLRKKFDYERGIIKEIVEVILETFTLVTPRKTVRIIKKQPEDNRILECGVAAKADFIVSGDKKHLLSLREYRGIKIISAKVFLKILRESLFEEIIKNRQKNKDVIYSEVRVDINKAMTSIQRKLKNNL